MLPTQRRFIKQVFLYAAVMLIVAVFVPRLVRFSNDSGRVASVQRAQSAFTQAVSELRSPGELPARLASSRVSLDTAQAEVPVSPESNSRMASVLRLLSPSESAAYVPAGLQADITVLQERLAWLERALPLVQRLAGYEPLSEFGDDRTESDVWIAAYYARRGLLESRDVLSLRLLPGQPLPDCMAGIDDAIGTLESFLLGEASRQNASERLSVAVGCARELESTLNDPAFVELIMP